MTERKITKPRPNAMFGDLGTIGTIDQGTKSSIKTEKPGKTRKVGGKFREQLAGYAASKNNEPLENNNRRQNDIVYSTAQLARFARLKALRNASKKK